MGVGEVFFHSKRGFANQKYAVTREEEEDMCKVVVQWRLLQNSHLAYVAKQNKKALHWIKGYL